MKLSTQDSKPAGEIRLNQGIEVFELFAPFGKDYQGLKRHLSLCNESYIKLVKLEPSTKSMSNIDSKLICTSSP